ncbi:MAG: PQQ-binding-like beta-propeller repeat protein [Candidatus Hydrogenedentes bacterium]|nr:PQQ-binding-like beta-propeller repeat protein [Candidatus Hydrogenedentota bacterium]
MRQVAIKVLVAVLAVCVIKAIVAEPVAAAQSPGKLLLRSGVKGGLIVQVGCRDGQELAALHTNNRFIVQGLDRDPDMVARARDRIRSLDLYGPVSVRQWLGDTLPYTDNMVNLLVWDTTEPPDMNEILRVLAPLGVAYVKQTGAWKRIDKPWPDNIDEWSHYLHGPDNNAVANDTAIGLPRSLQWVSGPRWGRSHEELASMSGAVSAKGRIFYIVDEAPLASIRYPADWKLVGRDAFNGILLWKRPIYRWTDTLRHFRSGPAHLPRRLAAAGDRVFVTLGLGAPVESLDAATGETVHTYQGTEFTEEIIVCNGTLYVVGGSSEVNVFGDGLSRRGEPAPEKTRYIAAIDVNTGKELWRKEGTSGEFVMPLTLAVAGGRVFFQSTNAVVCLDADTGQPVWSTPRPTVSLRYGWSAPTLVVHDGVVLLADRDPGAKGNKPLGSDGIIGWGIHGWNISTIPRKGQDNLIAYSADTGDRLWSCSASEGYNSPVDIFAIDGLVWVGPQFAEGRDIRTGKIVKTVSVEHAQVGMVHHRCYRDKASARYILTGKSGIEFIDLDKGWIGNNSWVRGTCQYGIIPCNGLLYAPPNACACFPKVKQPGFNAIAARRDVRVIPDHERLNKGEAYGYAAASDSSGSSDWPAYRHDAKRSGATSATVSPDLKLAWSVDVGDNLTQPVIADGRVFVVTADTYTVHALDAQDGSSLWEYTVGARIDSSPTVYRGLVLFGSADGRVYSLRASDGKLVWSFIANPADRMVGSYNRLESLWPVHGAVLVQNGELIFAAGRSSFLDGGIHIYRLDPISGKLLSHTVVSSIDPKTNQQNAKEGSAAGLRFDMQGSRSDILSGDGSLFYMKHLGFDRSGKQVSDTKPHLFSITGFLGEEWFIRSFWLYGTQTGAGYGRWAKVGNYVPAGRILSFDNTTAYGYGRTEYLGGKVGHRADTYQLYSMPLNAGGSTRNLLDPAQRESRRSKSKTKPSSPERSYRWTRPSSVIVRGMALAGDKLVIAGLPAIAKKDEHILQFTNPQAALDAFAGKKGALLNVVSADDGSNISEYKLESCPVMDGLSIVDGRVYMSLKNGQLVCWQNN